MNDPARADHPSGAATAAKGKHFDVLIAAYLFVDPARKDYDAVMDLAGARTIDVVGVVLASKDHAGEMHVLEAGDHLVRKGAEIAGGAGLVIGLFAPPLLAATLVGAGVGALVGKFVKHRIDSGIEAQMKEVLPAGAATLIAIYDHAGAADVHRAVANAAKTSVAEIDGKSVKELKAGLAAAQTGMKG